MELERIMKGLEEILRLNKKIRVIGIDDSPFKKVRGIPVHISGVVCSNTRFEGMLCDQITKDGNDATKVIIEMIKGSKFHDQLNIVLLDGITLGGFNIVDLELLSDQLQLPCLSVIRKLPNMEKFIKALDNFDEKKDKMTLLEKAGKVHELENMAFQVRGCKAEVAAEALNKLTDTGFVPEALRLAHLINSAISTGESSNRA